MDAKHGPLIEGLSKLLVERGFMSAAEASSAAKAFRDRSETEFTHFLLDEGLIEEADLLEVLSAYYQVPPFDVNGYFFDRDMLKKFPKGVLLRHNMIPAEQDENMLIVVAADPADSNLLPILGKYVSYDIRFNVGIARDIEDAVKEFYDESEERLETDMDRPEKYTEVKEDVQIKRIIKE